MGSYGAGDVDADGGDFGLLSDSRSLDSARDDMYLGDSVQTPVRPQMRSAGMPKSAQVRISTSSRRRTYSMAPRVFRLPSGVEIPRRSKMG